MFQGRSFIALVLLILVCVSLALLFGREPSVLFSWNSKTSAEPAPGPTEGNSQAAATVLDKTSAASAFSDRILSLFNQEDTAEKLALLDGEMSRFLSESGVSRRDKLETLTSLLVAPDLSKYQRLFVLDNLSNLHPVEKVPELTKLFHESNDSEEKMHVLYALRDIFTTDFNQISGVTGETVEEGEKGVFALVANYPAMEPSLAKYVVKEFTSLLPEPARERVLSDLTPEMRNRLGLTESDLGAIQFDIMVANPTPLNIKRYQDLVDSTLLESDSEFSARVMETFEYLAEDPAFRDLIKSEISRLGDLSLSPLLFVKQQSIDLLISGTSREDLNHKLYEVFKGANALQKSAFIMGGSDLLMIEMNALERSQLMELLLNESRRAHGDSRTQLLSSALRVSERLEPGQYEPTVVDQICSLLSEQSVRPSRCTP